MGVVVMSGQWIKGNEPLADTHQTKESAIDWRAAGRTANVQACNC
jgi:hypothetical protein